jgi:hypothetical protein
VVHAQALYNRAGRDRAVALLGDGSTPEEILAEITSNAFDPDAARRQYAVLDVTGRAAGHTGTGTTPYADDRQGSLLDFAYSVQGNILTSEAVITQASAAFESGGCDLAARLMRALEAGADGGEGDSRCTDPKGIPSDSAFVQVDRPNEPAGSYLELHVPSSGDENPLVELGSAFDAWRAEHPCPAGGGASGAGGAGAGAGTGGAGGRGGAATSAGASGAGAIPGSGGSGARAVDSGGEGCTCHLGGARRGSSGALPLAVVLLAFALVRRWNKRSLRC